jgi:hypothetical protein
MAKQDMMAPTSVDVIQQKVLAFKNKMSSIASFLKKHRAGKDIQILPSEFPLEFYVDRPAVARLIRIAMKEDFYQFGVFFGVETAADKTPSPNNSDNSFGKITACFLGLNKNREILKCHYAKIEATDTASSGVPGEETWPPPGGPGLDYQKGSRPEHYYFLDSNTNDVIKYFNPDIPK